MYYQKGGLCRHTPERSAHINQVYAVVLETNAKLSVIGMDESNTAFSLADVKGAS